MSLFDKRIDVLDKGWIELQDIMGDDMSIVEAARVSFLGDGKGKEADKKLLFYLMEHRHTTPFEMVEFKFRVRAPLLVFWQWVRHRTWSYNSQSGRYIPFDENDIYVPNNWRTQSTGNIQESDRGLTDELIIGSLNVELLEHYEKSFDLYKYALAVGVAKEQARLFLPGFSVYYTWVAKTDAHNLMHFLRLRMAPNAQEEIRMYAQAIYEHFFKPVLPWTAEAFDEFT